MSAHPNELLEEDPAVDASHWPLPEADQIEVLLLGSVHFTDPNYGDLLEPERQAELRDLTDQLVTWDPDHVAVEIDVDEQDRLDDVYRDYVTGARRYDEETTWEAFSAYSDGESSRECRSEHVQIGFRLADRLGLDRVHAVDDPMTLDAHLTDDEIAALDEETLFEVPADAAPGPVPPQTDSESVLPEKPIPDFLHWLHRDDFVRSEERRQSLVALTKFDQPTAGARFRTAWYERNLRILEHLWRAVGAGADRVAVVMGISHVHILRTLLDDASPFCPVNPRPLLAVQ